MKGLMALLCLLPANENTLRMLITDDNHTDNDNHTDDDNDTDGNTLMLMMAMQSGNNLISLHHNI